MSDTRISVGLAQIAPIWLERDATVDKVVTWINKAAADACTLVVFGEALLPGYPFWVERTDGARFDSELQKSLYAHYVTQAVSIETGDLDDVCSAARDNRIAVYLGVIERATDRGGHSLYCSMVYIGADGNIGSVHRKLMPTHEEPIGLGYWRRQWPAHSQAGTIYGGRAKLLGKLVATRTSIAVCAGRGSTRRHLAGKRAQYRGDHTLYRT